MASFASLLGSAAGGYQQAAELDRRRQFEDEQSRRQLLGGFFSSLAGNENVHPDVRNWAVQMIQEGATKPYQQGKPWVPDLKKMPVPQWQLPQQSSTIPGGSVQTSPRQITLPPPPVPGGTGPQEAPQTATVPGRTLQTLPQEVMGPERTAQGVFMPPELQARRAAQYAQAGTYGQMAGGIEARQQAIGAIIREHPELMNDQNFRQILPFLTTGTTIPFGMWRMQMAGPRTQMTVEQARNDPRFAQMVPPNLQGNELVNVQFSQGMQPLGIMPTTPTSVLGSQRLGWTQTTDADGNTYLVPTTTTNQRTLPGGQPVGGGQGVSGGGNQKLPAVPTPAGASTTPAGGGTAPKGARRIGHKPGTPMIVPGENNQPTMAAVVPGQTVPEGSVTPQQYGSANVPTQPVRTRGQMAQAQLPSIAALEKEIIAQRDNLGPLVGRINAFMQGGVGAGDPDYSYLSTKLGLVNTAMMMIHAGGRPAFGLMKKFDDKLNAGKMDAPTLLAGLRAIREQMETYTKEGKMGQFSPSIPEPPKNGPKFGEIEDGYIFVGGDPAQQSSWKKVTR